MSRTPYQPYGIGIYRREVSVEIGDGVAVGEVIDDFHHFRATIRHAGHIVTDVEGEAVRYPWATCAEATEPLRKLIGTRLERDVRAPGRNTDWRAQCTHLFDAASVAIARAGRGAGDVVYRIAVPDRVEERSVVELTRDGDPLLRWELDGSEIKSPQPFAGRSLFGLAKWALAALDPELAEATLVLQRACVISGGRTLDLEQIERADVVNPRPDGKCHTYTEGVMERGLRMVGTVRNLTDVEDIRRASLESVD